VDDLGGDREQKTVPGWRHLAPRYKRDVKLLTANKYNNGLNRAPEKVHEILGSNILTVAL
jgi:hypothetical protein